jgi:hypothetical protein
MVAGATLCFTRSCGLNSRFIDFLRRTPQVAGYENTLVFYETREQWNALTTEWVLTARGNSPL